MGGWSNLPEDLLRKIAKSLTIVVDRVRFSAVCKWWEFVAKSEQNYLPRQPPWLMLAENENPTTTGGEGGSKRGFAGLSAAADDDDDDDEHGALEIDFPESRGNRCVGSTGTWLITVDTKCGMHLLNPFSRDRIELPPLSAFGRHYDELINIVEESRPTGLDFRDVFITVKAVLCPAPSLDHHHQQQQQDFIVMAIYSTGQRLAFTRRGSKVWTTIEEESQPYPGYVDVIFHKAKGKFYGVTKKGVVRECDIDCEPEPKTTQVSSPLEIADDHSYSVQLHYLVECSGQLLQVLKFIHHSNDMDYLGYHTVRFKVFMLDFANGEWMEWKSLGRHSLFLGDSTSVALLADNKSTFQGNCIYFTDDFKLGYMGWELDGGRDMGVFDMEKDTIKPHYKGVSVSSFSPPIWMIPSNFTS